MKKTGSFVLVLVLGLAAVSLATEDTWTLITDMPTARRGLSATVINGKIYAIGGHPGATGGLKTLEVYDPTTDTWTTKASMLKARGGLCVSEAMGKIYAIGGMTHPSSSFTTVEEYDPVTDTWTTKSPMPTRRFGLSTSTVNGKIYAIGGQGSWPNVTSKVEEYDPVTDTWTGKADMPTARAHLSTSVVNGKIYAVGGGMYPNLSAKVEEYDPVTDFWTVKADMPTARTMLATCVSNGRIYAMGGIAPHPDGPPISTVEEYNPATDTWTIKPDMPTAKSMIATSAVNGHIYAMGGTTGAYPWPLVATVAEYAPAFPPPDLNGDFRIDIKDLIILIELWGTDEPSVDMAPPYYPSGDGVIDAADLEVLMDYWGQELDDPRLVACWRLDEAEGMFAVDSVGGNNGIVFGGPIWHPEGGQVHGALEFDGIDDMIITKSVLNPADGPFSVFAWIKGGAPGQAIIAQQSSSNWLLVDADGMLMTDLMGTGRSPKPLYSETLITDGNWHRVGFVWDGSQRTLYVDDVLVAADSQSSLGGSTGGLVIGVANDNEPGTFWSGMIDDVRVYDRVVEP